jgi:hypothetical protein
MLVLGVSACGGGEIGKPADIAAVDGGGGAVGAGSVAAEGGGTAGAAGQAGTGAAVSGRGDGAGAGAGGAGAGAPAGATGAGAGVSGSAGSAAGAGMSQAGSLAAGASGSAAAASGSTLIVSVGSWGFRGRSSDAASWTYCGNASTGNDHSPDLLRNVGYGAGVFIAVGGDMNGMVMRTLDGEHWQEDVHPKDACKGEGYPSSCTNWMGAVAYDAGVWIAGGGNGALMRSMDGGQTWTGLHPGFPEKHIRALRGGSGRVVAGTDGGWLAVTKNNGDAWTILKTLWPSAPSSAVLQIAHGAGTFVAYSQEDVPSAQRACFVSSDAGDAWQACADEVRASLSFVYDGARWVAPVSGGYATSPDAKSWTQHTASNVPSHLLFDGTGWFGRNGTSMYRGASLDAFARVAMNVSDYRGWTIGKVLDANLPVTGVAACVDNR